MILSWKAWIVQENSTLHGGLKGSNHKNFVDIGVVASFTGLAIWGLFSAAPRLDVTAETAHVVLSFQS